MKKLPLPIFAACFFLLAPNVFAQATRNWTKNASDIWNDVANWDNGFTAVPGALDTAVFHGIDFIIGGPVPAINVSVSTPQSVAAIRFTTNITVHTIGSGGQSLTVNGINGVDILKTGTANSTIGANLTLGSPALSVANQNAVGNLTLSNVIGGGNALSTDGTHTGTLAINGSTNTIFNLGSGINTLSNISASTVNLSGGNNSVSSASNTTINLFGGTNTLGTITGGTVSSGAVGTVNGPVVLTGGNAQSINGSNVGVLNVNGNLSYTNSTLNWTLADDSVVLADFDRILSVGANSISGSGSTLNLGFGPAVSFADPFWQSNQSWNIFTGFAFNTNPFSTITGGGAAPGSFNFSNGTLFFITAVPEPSSMMLVGLAIGVVGCYRRKQNVVA